MNYIILIISGMLSIAIFSAPGWLLYRFYNQGSSLHETIAIGTPVGIGISSLIFSVVGWITGVNVYYLLLVALVVVLPLWVIQKKHGKNEKINIAQTKKLDPSVIYFILVISIIIIVSHTSFGKATPLGYLYKDLYATDLLHHMSVFIHLTKGIPPTNPYYLDQTWHYYWISHIFPAFIYELSGKSIDPKSIMLFISLIYSSLFISVLSLFIKQQFEVKKVFVGVMVISLLAFGYNDIFILVKYTITNLPESLVNQLYLDRLITEKGEQYTGYSHSWFRSFLVEPHSTLALTILLATLLLTNREGEAQVDNKQVIFKGVLLGLMFSIDAFIGTISIIWYSIVLTHISWKNKQLAGLTVKYLILLSVPVIIVFGLLVMLSVIPIGTSTLVIKPYLKMILLSPLYFVVDYGPISILSVYGIYLSIKHKVTLEINLVIMAVVCMFFMFFVNLSDVGSTQMFRKAGLVLRAPLVVFSGLALSYILKSSNNKVKALTILAIVIAIPTLITDVYKLSDWKNTTSFLSYSDYEACKWIKSNLPEDSIIQDFPSDITKLLAFAERRVALGDWEHASKSGGAKPIPVSGRFGDIKKLFESNDTELSISLIKKYSIDYIYLTDKNRRRFIDGSQKYDIYKEIFREVYSKNGVYIYKIIKI